MSSTSYTGAGLLPSGTTFAAGLRAASALEYNKLGQSLLQAAGAKSNNEFGRSPPVETSSAECDGEAVEKKSMASAAGQYTEHKECDDLSVGSGDGAELLEKEEKSTKRKSDAVDSDAAEFILNKCIRGEINIYEGAVDDATHEDVQDESPAQVTEEKRKKRTIDNVESSATEDTSSKRAKSEEEDQIKDPKTPEEVNASWAAKLAKNAAKPQKPSFPKVSGFLAAALKKQYPEDYARMMGLEAPLAGVKCLGAKKGPGASPKPVPKNIAAGSNETNTRKLLDIKSGVLGKQPKKTGTAGTSPNVGSAPKVALDAGVSNRKGKRKETDPDDLYNSSKKQRRPHPQDQGRARPSAGAKKVRFPDDEPGTYLPHLRGGKCKCEKHADSHRLRDLCQKGLLLNPTHKPTQKPASAVKSILKKREREREEPEGERAPNPKRHKQ